MNGNKAPACRWWPGFRNSHMKRRTLYVAGQPTRYFIDTALKSWARCMGDKHGLYGAGMHKEGCAALLSHAPHLATLKHKAEQLAFAESERA